jgi:hypothetical protein
MIHEILKKLLKEIEDDPVYIIWTNGLCKLAFHILSFEEEEIFLAYLEKFPTKRVKRLKKNDELYSDQYYWKPGVLHWRVKWLKKHIKLTQK